MKQKIQLILGAKLENFKKSKQENERTSKSKKYEMKKNYRKP